MSSRFTTVEEDNLPLNENPDLRAILSPVSDSAIHSASLKENEDVCRRAVARALVPPLSPCSSSFEDEGSEGGSGSNFNKGKRQQTLGQSIILVDQSGDRERFTIGTSLSNDLVLNHYRDNEDQCYINHIHAQLYPDPDEPDLLLVNSSTSIFEARSLTRSMVIIRIQPGQEALLDSGTWQLTLGRGLEFEIKILAWAPLEEAYHLTVISPPDDRTDSSKPSRSRKFKTRHHQPAREVSPTGLKETGREIEINPSQRAATTQQELALPIPSATQKPTSKRRTIYANLRTKVSQTTHAGIEIVIKVCRDPNGKAAADAWRNEVEILKLLTHESIVTLRAWNASKLSLELEYAGQDLGSLKNEHRMSIISVPTAQQIWLDVSSGLEYIHSQKVLHLDIKPENILVDKDGRARVCDFGLSTRNTVEPIRGNGGTPFYLPPEYRDNGKRGRPGDIWAFGVVMIFVLGVMPLPLKGNWNMADILPANNNKRMPDAASVAADEKMLFWLCEIERNKERIPEKYRLLLRMLALKPENRITAPELVASLCAQPWIEAPSGVLFA